MKYIRNFKLFNEKYKIDEINDTPEMTSAKTYANKMEDDIKNYNDKKISVDNIYFSYTTPEDLTNKLKNQKFTKDGKFTNPLLGLYAQISSKTRKIKDLESEIEKGKQDLKDIIDNKINGDIDLEKSIQTDIDNINIKINDKTKEISTLEKDISDLQKNITDDITKMKKELISQQKTINNNSRIL